MQLILKKYISLRTLESRSSLVNTVQNYQYYTRPRYLIPPRYVRKYSLVPVIYRVIHARGTQTVSRCERCVTSSTHNRSAIEGMRDRLQRFLCDVCKRRFTSRSNVDYHTWVHTGERPFSWEKCKKRFAQWSDLISHLMLHNGEWCLYQKVHSSP
jgi:hypothetical protein